MSFELFVGGRPKGQVASISGMAKLTGEIKAGTNSEEISAFLLRGWSDDPKKLRGEIGALVLDSSNGLSGESRSVLRAIMERLPDSGTVSVSCE